MSPTMLPPETRKQVYDLTLADLERSPAWEFALDEEGVEGQDEATVRPHAFERAVDPSAGMFVVRARFVLADGSAMAGYLTPPAGDDSSLGTMHPVIVTPHGQVSFWYGAMAPTAADVADSYARLGKRNASQVFPLRFEALVPLVCGPVRGEIEGFLVLEDFRSRRTRTIL